MSFAALPQLLQSSSAAATADSQVVSSPDVSSPVLSAPVFPEMSGHLRQGSISQHRLHASEEEKEREREREREREKEREREQLQLEQQQDWEDREREAAAASGLQDLSLLERLPEASLDSSIPPTIPETSAAAEQAVSPPLSPTASQQPPLAPPPVLTLPLPSSHHRHNGDERSISPTPSTPPASRLSFMHPPPAVRSLTLSDAPSTPFSLLTTPPDGSLHGSGEKPLTGRIASFSVTSTRPSSRQGSATEAILLPVRSPSQQSISSLTAPAAAAATVVAPSPSPSSSSLAPSSSSLPAASSLSSSSSPSVSISAYERQYADRPVKVTTEALSLRKQSLRHPSSGSGSSSSASSGGGVSAADISDVTTLRALVAFQNREAASYKAQILSLTSENTKLAAELRAFPHSAAEVTRLLSSLRAEVKGLEGRVSVLQGEKRVWGVQMRNFHAEMSHMEKEWMRDRQRLEEAVRREEERNERMMIEWEAREEKMQQMQRDRRRELEEHQRLLSHAAALERRLASLQSEHARVLAAWREERSNQQEVEGRMKSELYVRLFVLMKEVKEKERESAQWEAEMGGREDVRRGVEEMEKRYVALMQGVRERDDVIAALRDDNNRLLQVVEDNSRAQHWIIAVASPPLAPTSHPPPAAAAAAQHLPSAPAFPLPSAPAPPPPPPAPIAAATSVPSAAGAAPAVSAPVFPSAAARAGPRSGSFHSTLPAVPFPSLQEELSSESSSDSTAPSLPADARPLSSSTSLPSLSSELQSASPSTSLSLSSTPSSSLRQLKAQDGEEEKRAPHAAEPSPSSFSTSGFLSSIFAVGSGGHSGGWMPTAAPRPTVEGKEGGYRSEG